MLSLLRQGALTVFIFFVFLSCKKDAAPFTPPTNPADNIIESAQPIHTAVSNRVNEVVYGYYSTVPSLYNQTSKKYPLLIFLPGAGQLGTTAGELSYLLNDGVDKLVAEKKFPPNFQVGEKN